MNESKVPPPMYLTIPGKDVRLHVKAMQFGVEVRKSFFDQKKGGWSSLLESAVSAVGSQSDVLSTGKRGEGDGKVNVLAFPLGGTSSRVDFCLQPGVVESEYIRLVQLYSEVQSTDKSHEPCNFLLSPVRSRLTVLTLQIQTYRTLSSVSSVSATEVLWHRAEIGRFISWSGRAIARFMT